VGVIKADEWADPWLKPTLELLCGKQDGGSLQSVLLLGHWDEGMEVDEALNTTIDMTAAMPRH